MISIQQYKPFHNSKDFEKIFKQSFETLRSKYADIADFQKRVVKKATIDKNIYIFYYDDLPVGYTIFSIKYKRAIWEYDFIIKKNKYRKYARIFRSVVLSEISKIADSLRFFILTENKRALNAMLKLPKHTNVKVEKEEVLFNKYKGFFYQIDLKQLDKLEQVNDSNTYETRACLHFGTFAPEISRAGIQNNDQSSIQEKRQK